LIIRNRSLLFGSPCSSFRKDTPIRQLLYLAPSSSFHHAFQILRLRREDSHVNEKASSSVHQDRDLCRKERKKSYCYTFSHSGSPCSIVFSVTCVCSISASSSIKDASDISSSSSREAHFPSSDLPFIQSVSRLPGLSYSRFRLSILKHFYFSIIDHSAV